MTYNDNDSGASAGMQFSIAGAVIMSILYFLQVTDTASFPLDPTITLSIAALAAVGAVLFYIGRETDNM